MKPDYTALDAAIIEHIRSGSLVHPMYANACRTELARVNPAWIHIPYIISERLQVLRKAGKIQHRRGAGRAGHGWIILEPPTDA